jgi:type II secretion system protein N
MEGVLAYAQMSFELPKNQSAAEANGNWNIEMDNVVLKQGTIAVPWPDSTVPTPVDLPRIALGNFKSSATIKKGQIQIVQTKTQSNEFSSELLGDIQLAKRLAYSEANLTLRLQVQPELLGRLGMLGSAVSLLPVDPQDQQWRKAQFSGQLSRLKMK